MTCPSEKPNGKMSLAKFAYLQLFALRLKADKTYTIAKFNADLREGLKEVEAKRHEHEVKQKGLL